MPPSVHDALGAVRVLLDLLEDVAGSAQAEQEFRGLVVGETDPALLDERTAARAADDDLAAQGDGWAPPAASAMRWPPGSTTPPRR